jgi:hypothetical protein
MTFQAATLHLVSSRGSLSYTNKYRGLCKSSYVASRCRREDTSASAGSVDVFSTVQRWSSTKYEFRLRKVRLHVKYPEFVHDIKCIPIKMHISYRVLGIYTYRVWPFRQFLMNHSLDSVTDNLYFWVSNMGGEKQYECTMQLTSFFKHEVHFQIMLKRVIFNFIT